MNYNNVKKPSEYCKNIDGYSFREAGVPGGSFAILTKELFERVQEKSRKIG